MHYDLRKPNGFTEPFRTWYVATGSNTITVASSHLLDNYAITLKTWLRKTRCRGDWPKTLSQKSWSQNFVHTQEQGWGDQHVCPVIQCFSWSHVAAFPWSVCRWDWTTKKLDSNLQLGSRSNFIEPKLSMLGLAVNALLWALLFSVAQPKTENSLASRLKHSVLCLLSK